MRRPRPLALLLALALVAPLALAACAGESTPGWTFAPTPTPTVAPSVEPTAAPTDGGTGGATPAPTDGGGGGAGAVLEIAAQNIAFDKDQLSAPADTPFQIVFANNDAGIPHNVEIKQNGQSVWLGEIFNGVETRTYDVPALPAGTYEFICTVHPNMAGTLTVGG
jgi:plastocyanin